MTDMTPEEKAQWFKEHGEEWLKGKVAHYDTYRRAVADIEHAINAGKANTWTVENIKTIIQDLRRDEAKEAKTYERYRRVVTDIEHEINAGKQPTGTVKNVRNIIYDLRQDEAK
ncbi:MAG: hypothetical protein NTZ04_04205 [Chloroflexi bacterium]|nr:hypothetical protein [Chloroflexota bacterium]